MMKTRMITVKRQIELQTGGYMDSDLVGIDDDGRFHVFARDDINELGPDCEPVYGFMTFSPAGKLEAEIQKGREEISPQPDEDLCVDRKLLQQIQDNNNIFDVHGKLHFESTPPSIPYFEEKKTDYNMTGPLSTELPGRLEMIIADLHPKHPIGLIKSILHYIIKYKEYAPMEGYDPNNLPGRLRWVASHIRFREHWLYPLSRIINPALLENDHYAHKMVPAAKDFLDNIESVDEQEAAEIIKLFKINDALYYEQEDDEDDDHEDDDTYKTCLGLGSQELIAGTFISENLAITIRRCRYLLEYHDGGKATGDLIYLDIVRISNGSQYEVKTFTIENYPWLRTADAIVWTGSHLFIIEQCWNEFYNINILEIELDSEQLKSIFD